LTAGLRLVAALVLFGALYAAFAPGIQSASADDTQGLSAAAQEGKALFDNSCISCHGRNAEGVPDRGPSLIGVGSAAVEFQVSTGRMPMARQEAQAERKAPQFTRDQAQQLGQYIQELGGGPQLPGGDTLRATGEEDIAKGGELFRVNCSSCHAFGAGGGALSSGKFAPTLEHATDRDIYAAMLTGPQNMPVFGDNQLTPEEKMQVIAYIQNLKSDQDPGGWGLGRLGPVPEGLAIFLIGMVGIVVATVWIAGKS
jgi:ubiquinol-cytochrome c reductase cytochrome c subunit